MRELVFILSLSGAMLISGCMNPALVKVPYEKPVTQTSDKTASIQLGTGIVRSMKNVDPGWFGPVLTEPHPQFKFDIQDQRIFAESLKDELSRLKLLHVTQVSEQKVTGADMSIELIFARTIFNPNRREYLLNVEMQLKSGHRSFERRYETLSSEGESFWSRMNTNVHDAKELAAKKLMAKLIPDIEMFVGALK